MIELNNASLKPTFLPPTNRMGNVMESSAVPAMMQQTSHQCMPLSQVTDGIRSDWESLRATKPELRSPFFSVAFTEAVDEVREGLHVGLLKEANELTGVLPFRRKGSEAVPPARGVNDAHGLITKNNSEIDPLSLVRGLGMKHYLFHSSPVNNPLTRDSQIGTTKSFLADLTVDPLGYENFLRTTSTTVNRQDQKTRRLQRELGPMRFEFDCRDERMLELLLQYKCQQYARNHTYPILAVDWIRSLILGLFRKQDRSVRGILNVLYFGNTPAALHFGIVEGDFMHYWYQAYAPDCGHGSPGTQLFLEVCREATARGYKSIDMGLGEQAYKTKLTNVVHEMGYGVVTVSRTRQRFCRVGSAIDRKLRDWNVYKRVKPLARRALPNAGGRAYID